MNTKEYKKLQKKYFETQRNIPGGYFDKYVIDYLDWKVTELNKAFRTINPEMSDSEAKAVASRLNGAIAAIEDILRRMR